jgi:protein-tyrosine phosphatase
MAIQEDAGPVPAWRRAAGVWAASRLIQYASPGKPARPVKRRKPGSARPAGVWDGVGMPWIDLEGAVNVRDLGALPTDDGGQTVAGRLLRADNLQELSPSDVSRLVHDIGLTTVVDLRSSAELASEGPAPLDAVPAVRHVHHPVVPEIGEATDVVAEALLLKKMQDRSRFPSDPTCGHYLGYLEDRPDQVLGAVRSIAHDQGAALVHCAAGKDRTGVVVALALTAAGVRRQAVVADYAATGERTEAIIGRLRRSPTYARDIDSLPADAHRPRAETMAAFLEQMDSRYGGVDRWLTEHGLDDSELDLLRAKLLRSLPICYRRPSAVSHDGRSV